MKINIRTQALLLGATLLGTILFTGTPAAAVNITNTVDEASLSASNWNSAVWGTPAAVPLATTNYFIGLGSIRTLSTTAAQSFNGATLQINNGRTLFLKHNNGVATVSLLTGGGGPSSITYSGGPGGTTVPLGGTLTLNNSVTIGQNQSGANTRDIWLLSTLSGVSTANLTVDQRGSSLVLFGTNTAFSGAWKILTGNLQIGNGASNALGTNSVTFTTVSTPVSLIFNSTNNFTVSNTISGPGSVIKQNTGTVTLAGANTFVGTVQVSGGVLQIGAGSSLATATNITLSGGTLDAGPIGGLSLAANETINGCNGTVISNLTAATGNSLNFNLSTPTNDVLNVTGSLTLSGTPTLNLILSSYKPTGTYRLINYSGTIQGGGSFTLVPPGGGASYTLDTATPGQVNLLVTNPVYSLTWVGDGSANSWDSSSPNWTGSVNVYADGDSVTFNDSGSATPNIAVATTVYPEAMTVNNTSKQYIFDGAGISCLGSLTKLGTNELDFTSTTNNFTGPVTISAGILSIGNGGGSGSLGSPSAITNNGVLRVNKSSGDLTLSAPVSGSGAVEVTGGGANFQFYGTNSYTGPTTIGNNCQLNIATSSGCGTTSSGTTVQNGGRLGVNILVGTMTVNEPITVEGNGVVLFPGALYVNSTGNDVTWGGPVTISADARFRVTNPGARMSFSNTVVGANVNLQCSAGSFASEFATTMTFQNTLSLGAAGSLTKDGQGVLVLAGSTNVWGTTTVNNGTLLVNGKMDGGTVTVNSPATVGGAGTILGGVSVQAGGTLAPGNAGIGTLTLSNTVALDTSAVTLMEINRTNAQNADLLVASAIPFDGTLTVVNTGPDLQAGDSFYLFAGTISGAFAATNLPALSSTNLLWDTSLLASSGVIKVAANTAPMPTITQPAVSGTNFTLQVTSSAVGFNYVLQATPSLAPAIWTGVQTNAGTGGTLNFSIPITPGNPQLFFRINVQ